MVYLYLLAGLALLLASGEFLVRGSVAVATRLGVSPLFIGLTLVGFGTSSPELMASVIAAIQGSPGIAVGNVVGSNIANILLILGVAASIRAVPTAGGAYRRDSWMMMLASVLLAGAVAFGQIDRIPGLLLLTTLVTYIVVTFRLERDHADAGAAMHEAEAESHAPPPGWSLGTAIGVTVASLAGVMGGAALLVGSAIELAREFGVPDTVIGLTMVAIGTSLPELVVSAIAAIRGQGEVAVGNILGSNIYNVLFILGVTALIHPIAIPSAELIPDVGIVLASAIVLITLIATGRPIGRLIGVGFLVAYAGYIAAVVL
jgi:cation:H+ antiporter